MNRKIIIPYKGYEIEYIQGSNWAYVGKDIFQSVLGAKQAITRRLNKKKAICFQCGSETDSKDTLPFFKKGEKKDSFYCGCFGWD